MADDYGVFPAAMYLANSKPDVDDEICEISLTEDVSQFEIEKKISYVIIYMIFMNNIKIVLKAILNLQIDFNLTDYEITYQLKEIVDDNLDKFSKEEQQELYKR